MVMGKHKGNSFENKILDNMRKSFGYNSCHKTKGSGSSKDDKGDLVIFGKYIAECKHHKELGWTTLTKFWNKIKKETDDMSIQNMMHISNPSQKYEPLIIFRENKKPIMVMKFFKDEDKLFRGITSFNLWKQTIKVM